MELKIILNERKINTLWEFASFENRCSNLEKNTVFVIQAGCADSEKMKEELVRTDEKLTGEEKGKGGYLRVNGLDMYLGEKERSLYEKTLKDYEEYKRGVADKETRRCFWEKHRLFSFQNGIWESAWEESFDAVVDEYQAVRGNGAGVGNFVILLCKWISEYFPRLFKQTKAFSRFPRFVYVGNIRIKEYLFFKLLVYCGCDVFAIEPGVLLRDEIKKMTPYAQINCFNSPLEGKIPPYDPCRYNTYPAEKRPVQKLSEVPFQTPAEKKQRERHPVLREQRAEKNSMHSEKGRELSYEELAGIAGSVVMITVYDQNRKAFATGSGVLIREDGYILTNFHVVKEGAFFSVRLEEEDTPKLTRELVKYHPENDLALLKIEPVARRPVPVHRGEELVRGQKVVAIGSPLGLFNTVSDGIIAGFRSINQIPMIQFTAPISHGSSGGALLNLKGELIGIVTAGFQDGQNLNLAVDCDTIRGFLGGFL